VINKELAYAALHLANTERYILLPIRIAFHCILLAIAYILRCISLHPLEIVRGLISLVSRALYFVFKNPITVRNQLFQFIHKTAKVGNCCQTTRDTTQKWLKIVVTMVILHILQLDNYLISL